MKKNLLISVVITLLFSTSCEVRERIRLSGEKQTRTYEFSGDIVGIDASHNLKVIINQGDSDACSVETDREVFPYLVVNQRNGVVRVYCEGVSFIGRGPEITVYLTVRNLREVTLSGASTCEIGNTGALADSIMFFSGELEIDLSGASTCDIRNIDIPTLDVELSGASELRCSGWCTYLNLDLSGASEVSDYDLICNHLEADLSGASEARCTVLDTLSVELSGASELRYAGDGVIVYQEITGASTLRRR